MYTTDYGGERRVLGYLWLAVNEVWPIKLVTVFMYNLESLKTEVVSRVLWKDMLADVRDAYAEQGDSPVC